MTKITDDEFDENTMFGGEAIAPAPSPLTEAGNPLSRYFRLPGLSVSLPTGGAFFPAGGIELDAAGEVSVLPMRAADELRLSSPDALMNNSAITGLLQSCVPAIKMPEYVSSPDLDVLLIAIRVASNGENMDIELNCPECGKETVFEVNLPMVLGTMTKIPATLPLRLSDDVVVYLRPHAVSVQTKILVSAFRETRNAQAIDADPSLSEEERSVRLTGVMDRLNEMNIYGLAHSIIKVVVPGHEVTDLKYISEYLANTDKGTLEKLRNELERINSMGIDKSVPATCSHCSHNWVGSIEFNPATFFEERSSD